MRITQAHIPVMIIIAMTLIAGAIMVVSSPDQSLLHLATGAPTPGSVSGITDSNIATSDAVLAESATVYTVDTFLVQHVAQRSTDGVTFCAHQILGSKEEAGYMSVYLWIVCQEYKTANSITQRGIELNTPVVLSAIKKGKQLEITGYRIPSQGTTYKEEVRFIFPETIQKRILLVSPAEQQARTKLLQEKIDTQKNRYF